jgi:hypothetical protein
MIAALRNIGKSAETEEEIDENAETAKGGAEAINEALPEGVSGRKAVLAQREKMRRIDKILEDGR